MGEIVIKIENLSKLYRLGQVGTGTLGHDLNRWWAKARGKEDPYAKIGQVNDRTKQAASEYVWALKDVNFEVKHGEVLGIIGRNGAGKSTLLKLISRITAPTTGEIKAKGRIASLLEVGTGMHPEMTARENIFLNGAILGMRRHEIARKFDDIVDFAGCAMYVDTPVKRYSLGMRVRLGFAVAAFLEPDILIVDEVLAVGDAEFQKKAIGKMKEVSSGKGRTVLFVSHNMGAIQKLCSKVIVFNDGKLCFEGDTEIGIQNYLSTTIGYIGQPLREREDRKGNDSIRFTDIRFEDFNNQKLDTISTGKDVQIRLYFRSDRITKNVIFRIMFIGKQEELLFVCNNFHTATPFDALPLTGSIICKIPKFPLSYGDYFLNLQCKENNNIADEIEHAVQFSVESGDFFGTGKLPSFRGCVLIHHSWMID